MIIFVHKCGGPSGRCIEGHPTLIPRLAVVVSGKGKLCEGHGLHLHEENEMILYFFWMNHDISLSHTLLAEKTEPDVNDPVVYLTFSDNITRKK